MQEHLLEPYVDASLHARYTSPTTGPEPFKNWDPYVNQRMDLPTALARPATPTSTTSATASTRCRRTAAIRCRTGRGRFGFGEPTGHRRRPARRPACCRRPSGASRRSRRRPTRAAGRSTALEAGRLDPARDRPEGPARDAAADGALLRADRERRQARDAAPPRGRRAAGRTGGRRACCAASAPSRRGSRRRPGGARGRPGRGSTRRRTRSIGTSSGVFGNFPVPIAGKTGTAEKVVPSRATGPAHRRTRRGGAATGRPTRRARRLRHDRERRPRRRRGGAGGAEGLRAVLRQAGRPDHEPLSD